MADFMRPDRIVIGAFDEASAALVAEIHEGVDGPVMVMDVLSAETVKLTANALLATKISFANEVANLCEATGADVERVMGAVGADRRLGAHFLKAGVGWGGSCFPKDSMALKQLAANSGYPFQLLNAVIEVNDLQRRRAVNRLKEQLGGLSGKTVALLGLTFKANTDDMREAPSTVIAARLLADGATVRCWDPMARLPQHEPWTLTTRHGTPLEAVAGADAAMIVTEWPQLRDVPWEQAKAAMAGPVLFDGRNVLDPQAMAEAGFTYLSVGRATTQP